MQTQHVTKLSELQYNILSEIPDAVIVTDTEQHVIYWNGPAERLYGVGAEQTLGHPLRACCPALWESAGTIARELLAGIPCGSGRWSGEIACSNATGREVSLHCLMSVLRRRRTVPMGLLWILRDLTERKELELDLERCRARLAVAETLSPRNMLTAAAPVSQQTGCGPVAETMVDPSRHDVVLWAEDDDDDAALLSRAWHKAEVNDDLIRVRDGGEVIRYLSGAGVYSDRARFPLPGLVLLDLNMPAASGLDVIHWMRSRPEFRDLPVVILTASAASSDVHEAAQLGVKGYLIKPLDPMEWVLKVRTVTAQCR